MQSRMSRGAVDNVALSPSNSVFEIKITEKSNLSFEFVVLLKRCPYVDVAQQIHLTVWCKRKMTLTRPQSLSEVVDGLKNDTNFENQLYSDNRNIIASYLFSGLFA